MLRSNRKKIKFYQSSVDSIDPITLTYLGIIIIIIIIITMIYQQQQR